jgi:hypothetical protein
MIRHLRDEPTLCTQLAFLPRLHRRDGSEIIQVTRLVRLRRRGSLTGNYIAWSRRPNVSQRVVDAFDLLVTSNQSCDTGDNLE